jgi:nucleotide-binding universal stress UspA family protein
MLYATDLAAYSIDAMRYAVNYANQHKAKLIVFHVINQRSITCAKIRSNFFNLDQEHKIRQKKVNAALKRMENLLEIIRKKELNDYPAHANKIEHLVVHYGRIAEEIVERANRWGCELIILGPYRNGFLRRIFLPSISRKVIRRTDTSVHVIKLSKGEKR